MISVVVPIYNVSAYLEPCVRSICGQTERELEILLVDDGSTDGSAELCDALAAEDDRIRVFHKPNGGLMSAWKFGAARATGEYIGFVDSDDDIDPDMYEVLLACARRYQADVVCCGLIREYGDHSEPETIYLQRDFYDRSAIEREIFPGLLNMGSMMNRYLSPNRVTKLYRRELIQRNLAFCDQRISLGEDLLTTFTCLCDARSVALCRDFFPYHYRIRATSIMGAFNPRFYQQSLLLTQVLAQIAREKNVFDFTDQLTDNLLSMAYYGLELNIQRPNATCREVRPAIAQLREDPAFRQALAEGALSRNSSKCRIYRLLMHLHWDSAFYWFVRKVVLPRRR